MPVVDNVMLFCILFSLLIRWNVSRFPYSGAKKPPLYGDYEAQRHWTEITYNLKAVDWYTNGTQNDLQYWGLDYPPLTAYHSLLNGVIASYINPDWITLYKSRGMSGYNHKIFMRSTVFLSDLLVYIPAVVLYWISANLVSKREKAIAVTLTLLFPGLILIDHGHFQYNCVSLGLTLWAIYFLASGRDIFGSICFTLALNYKQMSLYHSFPFFFYLLGKIFHQPTLGQSAKLFAALSFAVISTFLICWTPFVFDKETLLQVIRRLFPLNRGLYEDKVANIWCAFEPFLKLKRLFSQETLALISGASTALCLIPSNWHLIRNPTIKNFKLGMINSSLVFFLLSYQVHEKSILLVALPVLLQLRDQPLQVLWFAVISTFSLQPLLIKDGLLVPYFALLGLYFILFLATNGDFGIFNANTVKSKGITLLFIGSMMGCLSLSLAHAILPQVKKYPDLFSVLNVMYSCVHFISFAVYFTSIQLDKLKGIGFGKSVRKRE